MSAWVKRLPQLNLHGLLRVQAEFMLEKLHGRLGFLTVPHRPSLHFPAVRFLLSAKGANPVHLLPGIGWSRVVYADGGMIFSQKA